MRHVQLLLALLLFFVMPACSKSTGQPSPALDAGIVDDAPSGPDGGCAPGTQLVPAEGRCEPVLPSGTCAPGTFPRPGVTQCQPVGWTSPCPQGFAASSDGWGCVETIPAAACAPGTREDVATGTCVTIGDCSAPFPPAAATLFVNASFTASQIDGTHFLHIQDAVNAATSGATIAISPGTYQESVGVIGTSLTLIGQCAEKVILQYASGNTGGIYSNETLTVSGVTITGFPGGVLVQGGNFTLEDSLVTGNTIVGVGVSAGKGTVLRSKLTGTAYGSGMIGGGAAALMGGALDIEDSSVVDNAYAGLFALNQGSTITAVRVVASRNSLLLPSLTTDAAAIKADDSGKIDVSQSVIDDAAKFGVEATNSAKVTLSESVVRSAQGSFASSVADIGGVGLFATSGGEIDVTSSLVAENPVIGVFAAEGGTVKLGTSIVRGPLGDTPVQFGRGAESNGVLTVTASAFLDLPQSGIAAQTKAQASLDGVFIHDVYPIPSGPDGTYDKSGPLYGGFGLDVEEDSTVTVTNSTIDGCALAGLDVNTGSTVTATNLLIQGTIELALGGIGAAIEVANGACTGCPSTPGTLTVTGGLFLNNVGEGVLVDDSAATFTTSTIRGTMAAHDGTFGHGIVALDGADVSLTDVGVDGNANIGVAADSSQVRMVGGAVANNAVGIQAQDGSFLTQSDDPGALQPDEVRVSVETVFTGNGSREGSGVVPLPTVTTSP